MQAVPQAVPPRRRIRPAYIVLALIAGLAIGGYYFYKWWTHDRVTTDDAQIEADIVPMAARVAGTVHLVDDVHDNQQVPADKLLIEIDPRDYQAKVHQAEADLEAARAQADAADAQVAIVSSSSTGGLSSARAQLAGAGAAARSADAEVKAAQSMVDSRQTALTQAETELARAKHLVDSGAITRRELESTQATRDAAASALTGAQAQLAAARAQRLQAGTKVEEAQGHVAQSAPVDAQVAAAQAAARLARAKVKSAEAALEIANLAVTYTKIRAPAAGTLSRIAVHEGQTVQAGQTVLMLIPGDTYVIANFKETDVARIHPGDKADIEVDAYGDRTFHGVVESVAATTSGRLSLLAPDNATGNFVKVVQRVPVRITWHPPADLAMRPGLSADVTVHVH